MRLLFEGGVYFTQSSQLCGYYSRVVFISLRAPNCAATIRGWYLIEEIPLIWSQPAYIPGATSLVPTIIYAKKIFLNSPYLLCFAYFLSFKLIPADSALPDSYHIEGKFGGH